MSASPLCDKRTNTWHVERKNEGHVFHDEIMLPKVAPGWMKDPSKLWNANEASEKRKDAQVGRTIVLNLPHEFTDQQRLEATRTYGQRFTALGLPVQMAIHRPHTKESDSRNHHAHLLISTRRLDAEGFRGVKVETRKWNNPRWCEEHRQAYIAELNRIARRDGVKRYFDPRTNAERSNENVQEAASLKTKRYKMAERGKKPKDNAKAAFTKQEMAFARDLSQSKGAKRKAMLHPRSQWTKARKGYYAKAKRAPDSFERHQNKLERNARRQQYHYDRQRAEYEKASVQLRTATRQSEFYEREAKRAQARMNKGSGLSSFGQIKDRREALKAQKEALRRSRQHREEAEGDSKLAF